MAKTYKIKSADSRLGALSSVTSANDYSTHTGTNFINLNFE